MPLVSEAAVLQTLQRDNPWWRTQSRPEQWDYPKRAYFQHFWELIRQRAHRRTVVLLGPRRVGKTVMLLQTVEMHLRSGGEPNRCIYVALDSPAYARASIEEILTVYVQGVLLEPNGRPSLVLLDEIQFRQGWENELKVLTDAWRDVTFVASGSAASALAHATRESGAGRFTEFELPPLLFNEYLKFRGLESLASWRPQRPDTAFISALDAQTSSISELNAAFETYVNYGGFPEFARSDARGLDARRFVKSDIVDKVLLRDLPQLYGVSDVQELHHLFSYVAFRTGSEITLEGLSQSSQVAKNTIKRYIEYLEAAFLIRRVERVDQNARKFQRAPSFKLYLLNASLRAALFAPVAASDAEFGALAETALYAHLWSAKLAQDVHFARWDQSEIDFIGLDAGTLEPRWGCEAKWSDRHYDRPREIEALVGFAKKQFAFDVVTTSRTRLANRLIDGVSVSYIPTALACWTLGQRAGAGLLSGQDWLPLAPRY